MSLKSEVDQTFLALVESGNIRYEAHPVGAGIALVSDGVVAAWAWAPYIEIVAAAVVPNPCWLVGCIMHTCAVETHYGDIAIASGALAAEVDLIILPYAAGLPGVTVLATFETTQLAHWFPYPVKVAGTPRLAARIRKDTAASAAGGTFKVIVASAVGT